MDIRLDASDDGLQNGRERGALGQLFQCFGADALPQLQMFLLGDIELDREVACRYCIDALHRGDKRVFYVVRAVLALVGELALPTPALRQAGPHRRIGVFGR